MKQADINNFKRSVSSCEGEKSVVKFNDLKYLTGLRTDNEVFRFCVTFTYRGIAKILGDIKAEQKKVLGDEDGK